MEFQSILDAVRGLSSEDQLRLVRVIQSELGTDESGSLQTGLPSAMAATVQARVAKYQADPSIALPWSDVEKRMDKLLKELGE
jgi:putative addiction module component (TIGR02574 family)